MDNAVPLPLLRLMSSTSPDPDHSVRMDQVCERYLDSVYRFLYTRVGNREDAEDLTSEVFLKASQQLDSGRAEASVAKWLFTVARTVLADHWRQYYKAGPPVVLDEARAAEMPLREVDQLPSDVLVQRVASVLDALPERYRTVLELRFLRGYSIQETAGAMNITSDNAKVLQHRALARAVQVGEGLL